MGQHLVAIGEEVIVVPLVALAVDEDFVVWEGVVVVYDIASED